MPTLCTFNVNNLYVRYRFSKSFPGDLSGKSAVSDPKFGYLPNYNQGSFKLFNLAQRQLAARAITRGGSTYPDILVLEEVESLIALRSFNQEVLKGRYPYALLIDSRDMRQIDVAVLSMLPITGIRSHVDDPDPKGSKDSRYLFSRDCLELTFDMGGRELTVFHNHLKSKFIGRDAKTPAQKKAAKKRNDDKRSRQAESIAALLKARFPGPAYKKAWFVVTGDLNDEPASPPLDALLNGADLEDALARIPVETDRWTHWWRAKNQVSQLDYILLSPALSAATAGGLPVIERRGISHKGTLKSGLTGPRATNYHRIDSDPSPVKTDFGFARFAEVSSQEYASDHCPVFLELP